MLKNQKDLSFRTRILLSQTEKKDVHGALNTPVYRNAAFEFNSSEDIAKAFQNQETVPSHTYSRITNPSVEDLESKIKAASEAHQVQVLSSGMAAISNTFMALAYAGGNIVTSPHLFGNTFSFLKFTMEAFGVEIRFVDVNNPKEIEAAIDENTCAFFCELITNPHMEVANLEMINNILKTKKVPLIVDTTIIPWCGFRPQDHGIDIEIVSTTKYISGGATSLGGAILDYNSFDWSNNKRLRTTPTSNTLSAFMFKIKREIARNLGATMDPDTAYLQSLGMETLALRYEKMSANAYELAQFLEKQDKIVKVNYLKLDNNPYKKLSDKLFIGNPGAMLTFNLADKNSCYTFMDKLNIIHKATNLFDNKTLIIHPESTIYGTFTQEMKDTMEIEDNLLRLSVGLEDMTDIKNDIVQALDNIDKL